MFVSTDNNTEVISFLFREEFAKMTAVLCRHFGFTNLEIAEDIASDSFLKASETWAITGIPENPAAWLYTVAKNKAKDYFRRDSIFKKVVKNLDYPIDINPVFEFSYDKINVQDSLLNMIFAICNPINSKESQICLALQVLGGFSIDEIANAFLSNRETIKKRLQRARANLRKERNILKQLTDIQIKHRLEVVYKTIYLLFNEGYYSKSGSVFIKKELCAEAIRLTFILLNNPLTNTAQTNALLALLCFQSSRLEARLTHSGENILFDNQDKQLWDKDLIRRGNYYLSVAFEKAEISKYHLEAAIAYWHTNLNQGDKWTPILELYNQLILIEYSPITALNRAFAFAKVNGYNSGIREAEKLKLVNSSQYHQLLGYLYSEVDKTLSLLHYEKALEISNVAVEKHMIHLHIEKIRTEPGFLSP